MGQLLLQQADDLDFRKIGAVAHVGDGAGIPVPSAAGSIFHSLTYIVLLRDARAAGYDCMAARLQRGHRVGRSVVVRSCGVQLGRFHGKVPTAIGGPAAGVWGSQVDSPG